MDASSVIVDNFGKILAVLSVSMGLALMLAQIAWKLLDAKFLKNGNGSPPTIVNGLSQDDRRLLIELCEAFRIERESAKDYRSVGYPAIREISTISVKFEKLTDALREHTTALTRLVDRIDRHEKR